ncbi:MAG: YebC/PmpR family DNA-binding transcriptional regulator [Candidatus Sericytochromatia bacterium]|nr:YebC/PmpR family DNA-binding transcriptional regulator [Candidatus Sericytochromatia bacterium]
MGRKWENIKRSKGKLDSARSSVFVKMAREIIVSARQGGGDPAGNFRLRQAIDRAKELGVPNDNILRAIRKGTGEESAETLEEITYEGYGPGGVAIVIDAMTDNRNRTAGEVRAAFNKAGGNLGETGCVGWMFRRVGVVVVPNEDGQRSEEDLLLLAADAGAEDLRAEDGELVVECAPEALEAVTDALRAAKVPVASAEVSLVPANTVLVEDRELAKKLVKLMNTLDELGDVQTVTANFDMPEALMAELAQA